MNLKPYYETENGKLYRGDCLEVMELFDDKQFDLVLTDPPYGIGVTNKKNLGSSNRGMVKDYGLKSWDKETPKVEIFDQIRRISVNQIIFGGNYFIKCLDPSPCWLVWDKENTGNFADCELAWTNFKTAVRKFKWKWQGMLQENMGKHKEKREHPTQKPLELMRWCLENYGKESQLIIDPFGGSGTTARACKDMGKDFIIIDKEEKYCEIMEKRLEQMVLNFD